MNDKLELTATLMIPTLDGPKPFVSFIHGSGISDRNNYWYQYQADYLAKNGIIVLLPDKRGCGKSAGEWHNASFHDFAMDVIAGIEFVEKGLTLEISKTGIIGLSQGGWISHLTAQKTDYIDFVIDVVSSATSPNEQIKHEIKADLKSFGIPDFFISMVEPVFTKRAKLKRKTWWEKNGNYNPLEYLSKSGIPTLKIFGRKDEADNVPVKLSLERIDKLTRENPQIPLTIKVYEDSGHAMEDPETGWVRSDYLESVIVWISNI